MSEKDEIAISIKNISKDFLLPHRDRRAVKSFFLNPFSKSTQEKQHALNEVTFEIKKGEFFGIVGRNGSGKSTLLKCMAGVYTPDKGRIKVNGTLVPFIELGVGFNPELSGRDNVYLNGSLLGFSRRQIDSMYEEIVEFAELERFMDQKLKNYSSGMQVRLAFSIAIQAKGDILLLDEVLAVGDAAFQQKCYNYFEKLRSEGVTVILVTHSMESVERYCDRALLLESGVVQKIDTSSEIAQLYSDVNTIEGLEMAKKSKDRQVSKINRGISINVQLTDHEGKKFKALSPEKNLKIKIDVSSKTSISPAAIGIIIFNPKKVPVFASNTKHHSEALSIKSDKEMKLLYEVDNIFSNDVYTITTSVKNLDGTQIYYKNNFSAEFVSIGRKHAYAVVSPSFTFKLLAD